MEKPRGCVVTIYFSPGAARSQVDRARELLRRNPKVKTFAFVSRKVALKRIARKYPALVKNLGFNPLPSFYEVVARAVTDVVPIESSFPPGIAGVTTVKASGSC